MEREDFVSAAIYNARAFIEEWFKGQTDDNLDLQFFGELLRKAAQYGSVSVVELLLNYVDVNEQVQEENGKHDGWTALHFASSGFENVEPKQIPDLLLVIYELVSRGANPTLKCSAGHQPKQLAHDTGFERGVVLLDISEKMWINKNCNVSENIAVLDIQKLVNLEKLVEIYKQLVSWSFAARKFEVFDWILTTVKDPNVLQRCWEADIDGMPLYHFAASVDKTEVLQKILQHQPPANFINNTLTTDSGSCCTPLSLMLLNQNVEHIKVLMDWDLNATSKLTKIDLSKTNLEVFSLGLLTFSRVETLILDNTGLKMLTTGGTFPMPDLKSIPLSVFKASHNHLTEVPRELFCLPKLNRLDVSNNQIATLPDNWWHGLVLENLNVSNNRLEELPLPEGFRKKETLVSKKHHALCGRSELIFNELPKVPTHYSVTRHEEYFSPLLTLNVNHNNIRVFPRSLSCCVPVLKHLDLSHNLLTRVAYINELPLSLDNLNVSHNKLSSEDATFFEVSFDREICVAALVLGGEKRRCHHKSHITLPKLCTLVISHNENVKKIIVHSKLSTGDPDASFSSSRRFKSVHLFFPHLYRFDISYCDLAALPKYFGRLNQVDQLNISGNRRLKIPIEVCQLKNLFEFEYKEIDDEEKIAKLDQFAFVKEKVQFLNPLYGNSADCCPPSIKLMILGSKGHGRSTLLRHLKLNGAHSSAGATGGILPFMKSFLANDESLITQPMAGGSISPSGSLDIALWHCLNLDGPKVAKKPLPYDNKFISFCTWCFRGDDKCVQQCFFTASALYVVCFKATEGLRGVVELEGWLLAIKARAAMSHVVVVGTHSDLIAKNLRRKEQEKIAQAIQTMYMRKSKVYPKIHGVEFVSCYEGKKDFADILKLTNVLYQVAHNIETMSTYRTNQKIKILEQNIPKGFTELQQLLTGSRMSNSDHFEHGAHVLTWSDLKVKIKENLTYLVPSSVHFMDETFMNSVVEDAVYYLISNGTLIHYNSPALSDLYFIDPQWLCDILSSVITVDYGSSSCWDRGSRHNGKLSRSQLEQTFSERGLPPRHIGSFIKLLCNFEIAVPLDADTLLIPSLIDEAADKHAHMNRKYTFPRQDIRKHISDELALQGSVFAAKVLPAVAGMVHATRRLSLHSTGLCYRRIVLLHHIPISFWSRLLARCLSSASHFYRIILNNCVTDMQFQRLANPGDVVIGQIPCQWIYWKTGITLDFDNRPLLYVSNLVNPHDIDEDGRKKPFSDTVRKIEKMGLFNGRDWQEYFGTFKNGFEISVPDYILESWSADIQIKKRVSHLLSAQIMFHVLEVIDEVLKEWFEGESGLYSSASNTIQQFVPCPHCFGDGKTPPEKELKDDSVNRNVRKSSSFDDEVSNAVPIQRFATVSSSSPMIEKRMPKFPGCPDFIEGETDLFNTFATRDRSNSVKQVSWNLGSDSSVGFTFKHCMWAARSGTSTIGCPHHGDLKLLDLIPDVVFRDMLHSTIDKSYLRGKHKLLGKGGFGTVYKVKLYRENTGTLEDVVVKVISTQVHNMMEGQSESLNIAVDKYADIRLELNKLCSASHKYIVRFIGMTMDPLSFILEWAPLGSFRQILVDYRDACCTICPESVLLSIQQISHALDYLHQEKSIVHFDLKPDNVLVFQFPSHTHHCFEPGKPLESFSCESCKDSNGKPGVLVKLADLGISAFIGPGGFHRKLATPGHTAPEAIKYMGKEQMTEKVDIFSLGMSFYELMTLRELPPEGVHPAFFDTELEKGRRPQFIPVDPKYPLLLNDCLVSCWAQDYVQRPSASELAKLMKPRNLSLVDSYNLGALRVADILVVTAADGSESLWVASCLARGDIEEDILSVYTILDSESGPSFKMDVCRATLKSSVLSLCQVDQNFVWIACQDGSIAICDIDTRGIVRYFSFDDLVKHGQSLKCMKMVGDRVVVLAYYHGMLAFIENEESLHISEQKRSLLDSIDLLMPVNKNRPLVVTKCLENVGSLNTVENICGQQHVIWCGCDNGTIYTVESTTMTWEDNFEHDNFNSLEITRLEVASRFNDTPLAKLVGEQDIVQLKSIVSSTLQKTVIYALHKNSECNSILVSCWLTDKTLQGTVNIGNTPVSSIFPQPNYLLVATDKGRITRYNSEGNLDSVLPGYHRADNVYMTSMHAIMGPTGFLLGIGHGTGFANGIPCNVLISIGKGCKGPFQQYLQLGDTKLENTYAILHTLPM